MKSGRILIVEDEPAMLLGLKDAFEDRGFSVLCASDGRRGLTLAVDARPELVLLDIMLPEINGYEVCRLVREQGLEMPIIMLTAKGQEQDIVLGLNLGADDYVTKPFKLGELIARTNAFLRRYRAKPSAIVRFGECELNLTARTLLLRGKPVELTVKEFALLEYFAGRVGRALARNDILNAVWGSSVAVTQRSVDRCVTTLRAKIEVSPREPVHILTIRDIGYRFETGNLDKPDINA
ncbi:MAG TPA: response regulator transcription factor [Bryobacteraceae bacterium]|nr:response regulator transcription factor [Bryobacteraceae bacterium]